MDIACDFRIGSIEAADEKGCVIATLFLDTTNALGEKELLKVFAKLDLIKRIQEFYAYDPTDYNESYINIFKLSLPVYLREHLTGLILSKLQENGFVRVSKVFTTIQKDKVIKRGRRRFYDGFLKYIVI